jgi:hypothetical protein
LRVQSRQENNCHVPIWRWRRCYFLDALDTPMERDHLCVVRRFWPAERSVRAEGICDMRQLGSLLRATRSRIGRRLSLIVAIAAASLPDAGV